MVVKAGIWSSGPLDVELPRRFSDLPLAWATRRPRAAAVRQGDRIWSYGELADLVAAMAQRLSAEGFVAGDRVLVVAENAVAVVVLLLACSRLDLWAVIVNARLSTREIEVIAEHSRPRGIFFTAGLSREAAAHAAHYAATEFVLADLEGLWVHRPQRCGRPEPVLPGNDQVGAMIYTSGTTGAPKGVMLTHKGMNFVSMVSGRYRGFSPDDTVYGVLPVAHVFGLVSMCLGCLTSGACLWLTPRFDPKALLAAMMADEVTVFQGVPAMYAKLLECAERDHLNLKNTALRYLSAGGSPLDLDLKQRVEAAFGLTLNNGYGLTECAPTVSQTRPENPTTGTSTGPLLPGLEAKLMDGAGQLVDRCDQPGELWIRGPNVMKGYYRAAEKTAEVLDSDGWYNTGDMALFDAAENLELVGRSKEIIIRSGFNVYPEEVEGVLAAHPAVTLAGVVGRKVTGNEEVLAFVQLAPGQAVDEADLMAWVAERVAAYKRPVSIQILAELPASSTGKIQKTKLRELAGS